MGRNRSRDLLLRTRPLGRECPKHSAFEYTHPLWIGIDTRVFYAPSRPFYDQHALLSLGFCCPDAALVLVVSFPTALDVHHFGSASRRVREVGALAFPPDTFSPLGNSRGSATPVFSLQDRFRRDTAKRRDYLNYREHGNMDVLSPDC